MIGAIVGDVIGSRFERSPTKYTDFELYSDGSCYTDDTVLNRCRRGLALEWWCASQLLSSVRGSLPQCWLWWHLLELGAVPRDGTLR